MTCSGNPWPEASRLSKPASGQALCRRTQGGAEDAPCQCRVPGPHKGIVEAGHPGRAGHWASAPSPPAVFRPGHLWLVPFGELLPDHGHLSLITHVLQGDVAESVRVLRGLWLCGRPS